MRKPKRIDDGPSPFDGPDDPQPPTPGTVAAPSYLSPKRKALFLAAVDKWTFDPPALEMLESACRLLDVADQAREVVAKEGLIVTGARGTKPHPAGDVERASRREAASIFSRLGIHVS